MRMSEYMDIQIVKWMELNPMADEKVLRSLHLTSTLWAPEAVELV